MLAKNHSIYYSISIFIFVMYLIGCGDHDDYLFNHVTSNDSGIHFSNDITESDSFNILNFHYIYNGAGVGIADLNHDELPDIVFSANEVSPAIYINQGGLKFIELDEEAYKVDHRWTTGVSIVDINADGWDDIYLSVGGIDCHNDCYNQLLIHQGLDSDGVPYFIEQAAAYGLEDGQYTQQAAFFDYDLDGDLDVYLLHNVIDDRDKNMPSTKHLLSEYSKDFLLENKGSGQFINVSDAEGISHKGYGLGITITDINQDHYPDIYVTNDFLSEDVLYINQGSIPETESQFKNQISTLIKHTSYNAMGVDIADINNDALPDIYVLDMLPETNERQKNMLGFMNYNKFDLSTRQGYQPQFIKNTLQVHSGFYNNEIAKFTDVSYFSGLHQTDWSWTPLLADFDNDGDKDIYVTNGYGKDITDLDFINDTYQRNPFEAKEDRQQGLYAKVKELKEVEIPNYFFKNEGDLKFSNQKEKWIEEQNSISNGAVYADLDLDGDLDIIVNNLNQEAYLLENTSDRKSEDHFLRLHLRGPQTNQSCIGASVQLWIKDKVQSQFQSPIRGYLSSVDPVIHFGVGAAEVIDSILIIYPWKNDEGHIVSQKLYEVTSDQVLHIDATLKNDRLVKQKTNSQNPLLQSLQNEKSKLAQEENIYEDFDKQHLLLRRYSRLGPCLASTNTDQEHGDELFIGGATGESSKMIKTLTDGSIQITSFDDLKYEVTDAVFFDVDLDGDMDLYTAVGGSEYQDGSNELQDQLYINNGKGQYELSSMNLPRNSSHTITSCDFDQDGDIDLFIGSGMMPGQYPQIPESHLLINENGRLNDDLNDRLGEIKLGMITDAAWSDIDHNGWSDLIVVGEWMPVTIFKNSEGKFTKEVIENTSGLWRTIEISDIDADGDDDLILGNHGQNGKIKASIDEPLVMYAGDLDQNGSSDPIIGHWTIDQEGKRQLFPLHSRDDVFRQLPKLENKYISYASFGKATMQEIFQQPLHSEKFLKVEELSSVILINEISGWTHRALPSGAQLAPINDILSEDFNHDGNIDLLLSMNDYATEINMGWSEGSNGLMLLGDGKGTFSSLDVSTSGFYQPGDGRGINIRENENGNKVITIGQNNGEIKQYKIAAEIML